jgi:hypothetical protein
VPGSPAYAPSSPNTPPNSQGLIPVVNLQPIQNQSPQNLQQTPNIVLASPFVSGVGTPPIIIQQPFVTTAPLPLQAPTSSPPLESILNVEEAKTENNPQELSESSSQNVEKKVAFNVASDSGENNSNSSSETKKITL